MKLKLRRVEERQRSLRTALCAICAGKGVRIWGHVLMVTFSRGMVLARVFSDGAGARRLRTPVSLRGCVAAAAAVGESGRLSEEE